MTVDVIFEDTRWEAAGLAQLAEVASDATLRHLGYDPEDWELCVMGCDDARIAELNEEFRDKGKATNVLSWPSEELGAAEDGGAPLAPEGPDPELGDIAISYETCQREAEAAGKPMSEHCTHLLIHATLHLLGYDHIRDKDATLMEAIEVEILGKMGFADPYNGS
ncbi:MAG: rRNA maturation RNase YbeY [Pseudomonadota bacterium]|nr:rRNA maturation RNase YbeY [Pseudomonadota bacterium]